MNDEKEPPHGQTSRKEEPIDVQRRAIRAAVRKRLRGEVAETTPRASQPGQHRQCYSSGDLSCDVAFNPLIYPKS